MVVRGLARVTLAPLSATVEASSSGDNQRHDGWFIAVSRASCPATSCCENGFYTTRPASPSSNPPLDVVAFGRGVLCRARMTASRNRMQKRHGSGRIRASSVDSFSHPLTLTTATPKYPLAGRCSRLRVGKTGSTPLSQRYLSLASQAVMSFLLVFHCRLAGFRAGPAFSRPQQCAV